MRPELESLMEDIIFRDPRTWDIRERWEHYKAALIHHWGKVCDDFPDDAAVRCIAWEDTEKMLNDEWSRILIEVRDALQE
jgi:hypothetical protein